MYFDIAVNIFLMSLGNPVYILAASTIGYMVFNSLDLVVCHMLRLDAADTKRVYVAPRAMVRIGVVFAAVNMMLLFVGSPSWGWNGVITGWAITIGGILIYYYRVWTDRRRARATVPARALPSVPAMPAGGR